MSIQYLNNGTLRDVTKQEFLTLVQHGIITPMTEIVVSGKKALASQIKGIVFPEIKRSQPEVEPEFELDMSKDPQSMRGIAAPSVLAQKDAVTFWTAAYILASVLLSILGLFYNVIDFYALAIEGVALEETQLGNWLLIAICLVSLFFAVVFYQYVKQLWAVVPSDFARTTPQKAAMFSFIPVFCFYWWFEVFMGLFQDMNKAIKHYGHEKLLSTAFIQFACIFWVISGGASLVLSVSFSGSVLGIMCDSLNIVISAAITLPVVWYIRQKVVEFIDLNLGQ